MVNYNKNQTKIACDNYNPHIIVNLLFIEIIIY